MLSPAHLPAWAVKVAAGNGSGHGLRKAARLAQPAPSVALSHCLKLRACISSPEKSPFPRNTCTCTLAKWNALRITQTGRVQSIFSQRLEVFFVAVQKNTSKLK